MNRNNGEEMVYCTRQTRIAQSMKTIRRRVFKGGRSMDLLGITKFVCVVYMTT